MNEDNRAHVVGLSGGKDSTALALRLRELHPDRRFIWFITPTGDELPEMLAHWAYLEDRLGEPLTRITNGTLDSWIERFTMLPNGNARWCTRVLKIEPCIAFLVRLEHETGHKPILYVGLRVDEEERQGLYSEKVDTRFPLREWGWGLPEVVGYLRAEGVTIPSRTDCARCYGQRIGEWWRLWKRHPALWAAAEKQEADVGEERGYPVTFRSESRDTWPASLALLRVEFEKGRIPRGGREQLELISAHACRVCSL
jgi:hypothetical protein